MERIEMIDSAQPLNLHHLGQTFQWNGAIDGVIPDRIVFRARAHTFLAPAILPVGIVRVHGRHCPHIHKSPPALIPLLPVVALRSFAEVHVAEPVMDDCILDLLWPNVDPEIAEDEQVRLDEIVADPDHLRVAAMVIADEIDYLVGRRGDVGETIGNAEDRGLLRVGIPLGVSGADISVESGDSARIAGDGREGGG